jgi:hypothetical protein
MPNIFYPQTVKKTKFFIYKNEDIKVSEGDLQSILTSTLDGGQRSFSLIGRLTHGIRPIIPIE